MSDDRITQDDIKAIRDCALQARVLSSQQYGEQGLDVHVRRAKLAEDVADKLESKLAVILP